MTLLKSMLIGFSALALGAGSAFAAGEAKDDKAAGGASAQSFTSLDTNKDGSISRTEVAAHADLAAKFKDADKDSDGKLTQAEYDAMSGGGGAAGATTEMKK